jgi:inosine/xanthosine triphosphatase
MALAGTRCVRDREAIRTRGDGNSREKFRMSGDIARLSLEDDLGRVDRHSAAYRCNILGPVLIVVGSTRPAKVEAARTAIEVVARVDERFCQTTIQSIDLTNVAPTMPMTDRAILDGARLRAQVLSDRVRGPEAQLTIGVEGGLDPLPSDSGRYVLKTWAAVTDGTRWGYGSGGAIMVPDAVTREVLAGRELGDVVDEVVGAAVRGTRGAWGILTRDLVGRQHSFTIAILAALAPFYNPALYQL